MILLLRHAHFSLIVLKAATLSYSVLLNQSKEGILTPRSPAVSSGSVSIFLPKSVSAEPY